LGLGPLTLKREQRRGGGKPKTEKGGKRGKVKKEKREK
jgi:hypothetical protein